MGTSCLIGIRHDDKIYSFRVNYNGYLTGVGQLLLDNFDTEEKVDELVKCGEICSLEPSIKDIKNHEIEYYEWHKNLKKKIMISMKLWITHSIFLLNVFIIINVNTII